MAELYEQLPEFARTHRLARIPDGVSGRDDNEYEGTRHDEADDIKDAHVITSHDPTTGMHRPILDIDLPAALIPSSTPGHYHLYIDKPMEWDRYEEADGSVSLVRSYGSTLVVVGTKRATAGLAELEELAGSLRTR